MSILERAETLGKTVQSGLDAVNRTVARLQGVGLDGKSDIRTTRARFRGSTSTTDWRVKLTLPPQAHELRQAIFTPSSPTYGNEDILVPLVPSNGMFWPLTPSCIIQHSANYNALAQTHSNYPFQAYQNSQVDQINIIGEFPVQNKEDASHWVATVHFLRLVTKMFFGSKKSSLKGNPPPVLFLNGYGENVFKNVPVVVNTFNVELQSGIDYISSKGTVNYKPENGFVDQDGFGEFGGGTGIPGDVTLADRGSTWAPTLSNISVLVTPVYSRDSVSQFSLSDFAKSGQINVNGENIGFI